MKKCELSRRNRAAELRDLQKRLQSFVASECKVPPLLFRRGRIWKIA